MSEEISREEIAALLARESEEMTREPCEDAISIQVVIEWLKDKDIIKLSSQEETARKELKALPSVTPKQRTGHWIECEDEVKCFCSECKEISDYPTKFCPNCGAKMVEPQERSEE